MVVSAYLGALKLNQRGLSLLASREIGAVGMVKHESAHAGLGFHHPAIRQMYADLFRLQQIPDALLVFHARTGPIAKAVALPAIARRETLLHGHSGRIGETPIF